METQARLVLRVRPALRDPKARRVLRVDRQHRCTRTAQGLRGPMGAGPGRVPLGSIGPQGPGQPSGAVIFVLEGTPCPAGYTMIGTMSADLKPAGGGGTSHVRLYVLRND